MGTLAGREEVSGGLPEELREGEMVSENVSKSNV